MPPSISSNVSGRVTATSSSTSNSVRSRRTSGARVAEQDLAALAPEPAGSSSTRKRRRGPDTGSDGPAKRRQTRRLAASIEISDDELDLVDLSAVDEQQATLGAQTQILIEAQKAGDDQDQSKPIGQQNCIICLDNFVNVTTTACGHLFCHECLTQALRAGEKTTFRRQSSCPVCRKKIKRTTKGHVIPLAFLTRGKKRQRNAMAG